MKKLFVPLLATTMVMLGLGLGGAVYAQVGDGSRTGAVAGASVGQGKVDCRMAFATETGIFTPVDGSPLDNASAATAIMKKSCVGPVEARFTTETNTPQAGDFITMVMRATCIAAGTATTPCVVGSTSIAEPGGGGSIILDASAQDGIQTNGMNMIFPSLDSGKWQFEALLGGDGTAFVEWRTLTVEAFTAAAA